MNAEVLWRDRALRHDLHNFWQFLNQISELVAKSCFVAPPWTAWTKNTANAVMTGVQKEGTLGKLAEEEMVAPTHART